MLTIVMVQINNDAGHLRRGVGLARAIHAILMVMAATSLDFAVTPIRAVDVVAASEVWIQVFGVGVYIYMYIYI